MYEINAFFMYVSTYWLPGGGKCMRHGFQSGNYFHAYKCITTHWNAVILHSMATCRGYRNIWLHSSAFKCILTALICIRSALSCMLHLTALKCIWVHCNALNCICCMAAWFIRVHQYAWKCLTHALQCIIAHFQCMRENFNRYQSALTVHWNAFKCHLNAWKCMRMHCNADVYALKCIAHALCASRWASYGIMDFYAFLGAFLQILSNVPKCI